MEEKLINNFVPKFLQYRPPKHVRPMWPQILKNLHNQDQSYRDDGYSCGQDSEYHSKDVVFCV